jgi:hypothetical protein
MVPLRVKANTLVFGRLKRLPILRTMAAPAPQYASALCALRLDRVSIDSRTRVPVSREALFPRLAPGLGFDLHARSFSLAAPVAQVG